MKSKEIIIIGGGGGMVVGNDEKGISHVRYK